MLVDFKIIPLGFKIKVSDQQGRFIDIPQKSFFSSKSLCFKPL